VTSARTGHVRTLQGSGLGNGKRTRGPGTRGPGPCVVGLGGRGRRGETGLGTQRGRARRGGCWGRVEEEERAHGQDMRGLCLGEGRGAGQHGRTESERGWGRGGDERAGQARAGNGVGRGGALRVVERAGRARKRMVVVKGETSVRAGHAQAGAKMGGRGGKVGKEGRGAGKAHVREWGG
jgi:hypothetical protein